MRLPPPRLFREGDPEPDDVWTVLAGVSGQGHPWSRNERGDWHPWDADTDMSDLTWDELLSLGAPLLEVRKDT